MLCVYTSKVEGTLGHCPKHFILLSLKHTRPPSVLAVFGVVMPSLSDKCLDINAIEMLWKAQKSCSNLHSIKNNYTFIFS